MQKIEFSPKAWEDYEYWETQDKKTLRKIKQLIKELQCHPKTGEGHPESLKDNLSELWIRHINKKDRIIYEIFEDKVSLIQLRIHYE